MFEQRKKKLEGTSGEKIKNRNEIMAEAGTENGTWKISCYKDVNEKINWANEALFLSDSEKVWFIGH